MTFATRQLDLPRRVAAYFLMFNLAAVGCLALVFSTAVVREHDARTTRLRQTQLRRAAAAVKLELARGDRGDLTQLLSRIQRENSLTSCSVFTPRGELLAHSLPGGPTSLQEPAGEVTLQGDIHLIRYSGDGPPRTEYRLPLQRAGQPLGTLRIEAGDGPLWSGVHQALMKMPLAGLTPLLLTLCGLVALQRTTRPYAEIESQLCAIAQAPSLIGRAPAPVSGGHAAAAGWNRLARAGEPDAAAALAVRMQSGAEAAGRLVLTAALDSLPEGLAVTDARGEVEYANRVLELMLAAEPGALAGEPLESRIASCLADDAQREQFQPHAVPPSYDWILETGGDRRVLRVSRRPLPTESSQSPRCVWTLRDTTQQHLREEIRRQYVETATRELLQPLAGIKAQAEQMTRGDGADVVALAKEIHGEAARLGAFVEDLQSISGLETGAVAICREPVDLERLVREAVERIRPLIELAELEFVASLPQTLPKLQLDRAKISACLYHLLDNAVKYTPAGGQITLRVRAADEEVRLEVEDSGYGIATDELSQVFDKFFRSRDPRLRTERGAGLGLALAKDIVQLHGGQLLAASKLDVGSTFTVVLPLSQGGSA